MSAPSKLPRATPLVGPPEGEILEGGVIRPSRPQVPSAVPASPPGAAEAAGAGPSPAAAPDPPPAAEAEGGPAPAAADPAAATLQAQAQATGQRLAVAQAIAAQKLAMQQAILQDRLAVADIQRQRAAKAVAEIAAQTAQAYSSLLSHVQVDPPPGPRIPDHAP